MKQVKSGKNKMWTVSSGSASMCVVLAIFLTVMTGCVSTAYAEEKTSEAAEGNGVAAEMFDTDSQILLQPRSMVTDQLENFQYLLYEPETSTENMPLIVYLHGASGKGEDLNLLTSSEDFPKYLQAGDLGNVKAYVVMPQLPSSKNGWSSIASSVYALIQETVSEFSIDEDNISLVGFSMGGTAVWDFAAAYPERFARIAPLSGSARGVLQQVSVLKEIPVRAFVGSADTVIKPSSSKEMVYALKKAGGTAELQVFQDADHVSVPSLTWRDKTINLVNWLIGAAS